MCDERESQDTRVRILFVLDDFPDENAGTERQFVGLIDHLVARSDFNLSILVLRSSSYLRRRYSHIGYEELDVASVGSPAGMWKILKAAMRARGRFDLVQMLFNDTSLTFPYPMRLVARLPVIVSRRDLGFWHTPVTRILARLNRPVVRTVLCNSRAVARSVELNEGIPAAHCTVIYNACLAGMSPTREDVGDELGSWLRGRDYALLVANLRPIKRAADAVRALHAVRSAAPQLCLVIAGGDRRVDGRSHQADLKALVAELALGDRVRFMGSVTEPVPLIARASICLLCSETEGFSNSLMEYAWEGRPIICTAVGGNTELVCDGVNGLLYEPGDVETLAAHIRSLVIDPKRATQLARGAHRRVRDLCDPMSVWRAHEDLYRRIAG